HTRWPRDWSSDVCSSDLGAKLEVLPTRRAVQQSPSPGKQVVHSVYPAGAAEPISPQRLGVVFNHAMQAQGYITGEIAFKMKDGEIGRASCRERVESRVVE